MTKAEKISKLPLSTLIKQGIYKVFFENDPKKRVYIGSAVRNGNAFNNYGIDNIRFEIIDILKPNYHQRYYEIIETGYIAKFNSVNNGWNINKNGRNCIGTPMREEVKRKISISNTGSNNGMYGKFNELNPNSKEVFQYDLEGNFLKKWNSARNINRELNISYKQISQSFKTKSKYCKGFLWYNEFQGEKVEKWIKYNPINHIMRKEIK